MSDFTVDRDSTKRVLGKNGVLVSYGTDEPAFEFNADGSYKGLLVEPAATNLCLQSEDLSTTWSPTNATPTQSTEETPDGDTTNKYIKLVDDNSTGTGQVVVTQTITVLGGTKYTASVFLKKDGLNWALFQAFGAGSVGDANPFQYFDLDNGVTGTGSTGIQDATIKAYPNGWYRCSITWTQGVGDTSFLLRIFVAEADNTYIIDRDGTSSIFVWGAQVEAGPIATSYISTKPVGGNPSAQTTRAKDDISLTSASSLIGQTEGTLFVEVDWRLSSGVAQTGLEISDNSNNNRIAIFLSISSELRMYLQANNVSQTFQGVSNSSFSGIQKIAFAYAENDFELYRNGSSISSDTSGSLAALGTLTDVDLGQTFAPTVQANMWFRAVALFDTRLSDAECEALTTL